MEGGYLQSKNHIPNEKAHIRWYNGTVEKKWYGYNATGDKELPIQSYRCPRCKKIELYADENMED